MIGDNPDNFINTLYEENGVSAKQGRLEQLIGEFEETIESGREQAIHEFLERNDWILRFDRYYDGLVLSKFRLAGKYVPDFVTIGNDGVRED